MNSSVADTFQKLKERNPNPVWLWSMMLTRGLNWGNVWTIFHAGVSVDAHYRGTVSEVVPNVAMLFSLPDSPTTVLELFNTVVHTRTHYSCPNGRYDICSTDDLSLKILEQWKGHVQCTWPQIKTILDANQQSSNWDQKRDFRSFVGLYCTEKPLLRTKTLLHMVATQHEFVGTYEFVLAARTCDKDTLAEIWKQISEQTWSHPEYAVNFIGNYFPEDNARGDYRIPMREVFGFLNKYPKLMEDLQTNVQCYAKQHPDDDTFFSLAAGAMASFTEGKIALCHTMNKVVHLHELPAAADWTQRVGRQIKPLLQAYLQLSVDERDTPEVQCYFATAMQGMPMSLENFFNGHCTNLFAQILDENPTGVMARIVALHACTAGLFPTAYRDDEFRAIKALLHHDPRSKTGQMSIIRKCIPDFKHWLNLVQGLGLSSDAVWSQGLQRMGHVQPELLIDGLDHLDIGI